MAADNTAVHDIMLSTFFLEQNRLHKATTSCRTISRINVDMLTPQARWAMVGIPIPHHLAVAVLAGKIFGHLFEHGDTE